MPRRWTSALRRLTRDADWDSAGPRAIETALLRDVREVLSSPGMEAALRAIEGRQQNMFGPGATLPRLPGNQLVALARDHIDVCYAGGLAGRDLLLQALGAAIGESLTAKSREITADVATRSPRSVPELRRRLKVATEGVAARVLAVALGDAASAPAPSLDLDANLLRGPKK